MPDQHTPLPAATARAIQRADDTDTADTNPVPLVSRSGKRPVRVRLEQFLNAKTKLDKAIRLDRIRVSAGLHDESSWGEWQEYAIKLCSISKDQVRRWAGVSEVWHDVGRDAATPRPANPSHLLEFLRIPPAYRKEVWSSIFAGRGALRGSDLRRLTNEWLADHPTPDAANKTDSTSGETPKKHINNTPMPTPTNSAPTGTPNTPAAPAKTVASGASLPDKPTAVQSQPDAAPAPNPPTGLEGLVDVFERVPTAIERALALTAVDNELIRLGQPSYAYRINFFDDRLSLSESQAKDLLLAATIYKDLEERVKPVSSLPKHVGYYLPFQCFRNPDTLARAWCHAVNEAGRNKLKVSISYLDQFVKQFNKGLIKLPPPPAAATPPPTALPKPLLREIAEAVRAIAATPPPTALPKPPISPLAPPPPPSQPPAPVTPSTDSPLTRQLRRNIGSLANGQAQDATAVSGDSTLLINLLQKRYDASCKECSDAVGRGDIDEAQRGSALRSALQFVIAHLS